MLELNKDIFEFFSSEHSLEPHGESFFDFSFHCGFTKNFNIVLKYWQKVILSGNFFYNGENKNNILTIYLVEDEIMNVFM